MRPEIIGSQIIRLESVDSTNEYCHKLLRDGNITEGTIVVAKEQTAGKGYGSNRWESEKGKNLTFSIVLFPEEEIVKYVQALYNPIGFASSAAPIDHAASPLSS